MLASTLVLRLKEENLTDKDKALHESLSKTIEEQIEKSERPSRKNDNSYGITVKGEGNVMVRFARCCNPVPGDDIMGYITRGRGVSVHRTDCLNLKSLIETDKEKVIEVSWGIATGSSYIAEIRVKADDRMGILTEVMQIISDSRLDLNSLNANSGKGNDSTINIKVKINSVEQLKSLMNKIRHIRGVSDVFRMNS